MNLGKNIRNFRKKKGLTQAELARKLGMSQKVVSAYERGYRFPQCTFIPKIAETLGVTIDALFKESQENLIKKSLKKEEIWKIVEILENLKRNDRKELLFIIENYLNQKGKANLIKDNKFLLN